MLPHLQVTTNAVTDTKYTVTGNGYRLSLLTPSLLRVETGPVTDEPTQAVWFRNFDTPAFTIAQEGHILRIETQCAVFSFDTARRRVKNVELHGTGRKVVPSRKQNLNGTARTLDGKFGPCKLGDGILSKDGVAVFDDTKSLIMTQEGAFRPRENGGSDLYLFAYGRDFFGALKALTALTGEIPMIPRYALGNWWSRYRVYTDREYLGLMDSFRDRDIPLSVATVDMDWHWTDLNKQFGTNYPKRLGMDYTLTGGWTGYSFNTELFPDYKSFLAQLRERDLKVTLNLHPADGVRFFETQYPAVCEAMGLDPGAKADIPFDLTDPNFVGAYFEQLHRPYERDGVDFWWIDWQQGKKSKIEGLDPLYLLNHYHYLDNSVTNPRPLILSRYFGIGSHRYPLGFSGDSAINWAILNFIPYFTATAANVGYTWWSHDIGGHHMGYRDDELYLRWLQYAVYNPIMRLHSTCHDLLGKEPWKYRTSIARLTEECLRERRRLIPYLYSMDYLTHTQSLPLCAPLYYRCPDAPGCFDYPNEYFFGTELLVCPITQKMNPNIHMAGVKAYLPAGKWTDLYTGVTYTGGRELTLYRDEGSIPVLAKEGAILPLDRDGTSFGTALPTALDITVCTGTNRFTLIEDDDSQPFSQERISRTQFSVSAEGDSLTFHQSISGDSSCLPAQRVLRYRFLNISACACAAALVGGSPHPFTALSKHGVYWIDLGEVSSSAEIEIRLSGICPRENPNPIEYAVGILSRVQNRQMKKASKYRKLKKAIPSGRFFDLLKASRFAPNVREAAAELYHANQP